MILVGIPLLWILPIWLSFVQYRKTLRLWCHLSVLLSFLFSWVGFILARCIYAGYTGYQEQRLENARSKGRTDS